MSHAARPTSSARAAGLHTVRPGKQGLYDPRFEHDACGVGFVVDMHGRKSHKILADALQDAGCDSNEVLNHCRDTNQPHVRGCWVIDLILGKV